MVKEYGEAAAVPDAGVPDNVAVPFGPGVNITPLGKVAPPSFNTDDGNPVVITVNELDAPSAKVLVFPLVNAGG